VVIVSRCLLGEPVRYDGSDKKSPALIEAISSLFSILPVCPEVEAGLTVPRPPIQLVREKNGLIRTQGRDDQKLDVTSQLSRFFSRFYETNHILSGAILQNRSPSCGVGDTPIFSSSGEELEHGDGIFTALLREQLTAIPISTPEQLDSDTAIQTFSQAVYNHLSSIVR